MPASVRFVMVEEGLRSWEDEAVPTTARIAVLEVHVRLISEEVVVDAVKKVIWVEVPFPAMGGVTVQFVDPGVQVGFSVSPGAYGEAEGAAKRGSTVEKRRNVNARKKRLGRSNCFLPSPLLHFWNNFMPMVQKTQPSLFTRNCREGFFVSIAKQNRIGELEVWITLFPQTRIGIWRIPCATSPKSRFGDGHRAWGYFSSHRRALVCHNTCIEELSTFPCFYGFREKKI